MKQVAFDYERQTWIEGQAAVDLRQRQLREELNLLTGPRGNEYARFVGTNRQQRIGEILAEIGN